MKKLTIAVDAEAILVAKQYARARGVSLSALIESALREMLDKEEPAFSTRWRGQFQAAHRDGPRYAALARKHL